MPKRIPQRILDLETENTKYCSKCKKIKQLCEFGVKKNERKMASCNCLSCVAEERLKNRYGMTFKDYEKMLEEQDGKCKICGATTSGGRGLFHVDHDHKTGIVRGLLCQQCNVGLGCFKDNPKSLASAITYLLETRKD